MSVEYFPVADDISGRSVVLPPGLFLLNESNYKFVSGQSRRIGSSRIMLIMVLIVAAIAGAICVSTWSTANELRQIEATGLKTLGTVSDGRSVRGRSSSYYITYRYRVGETFYTREQEVDSGTYHGLRIGTEVVVRYLPDNPAAAALSGEDYDAHTLRESDIVSAVSLVIGGIIVVVMLWLDWRNRRLSTRGRLLPGTIIHVEGRRGSKGAYNVTVTYRFQTPTGDWLEKKSTSDRRDLRNALPPNGSPVMVLYISDRFQRLM